MLQKMIFVCGLIYPTSLLSVLLSGNSFEDKIRDNCPLVASIGGLSQRVNLKRGLGVSMPPAVLHPWQAAPPLPTLIEIDLSNHYTQNLPSPDRWRISERNA